MKTPQKSKLNIALLLILPLVVVFDFVYFFVTRPTCIECWNPVEFIHTSSLSAAILMTAIAGWRKK